MFSFIPKLNTWEDASGDIDGGCKFSAWGTGLITESFYNSRISQRFENWQLSKGNSS